MGQKLNLVPPELSSDDSCSVLQNSSPRKNLRTSGLEFLGPFPSGSSRGLIFNATESISHYVLQPFHFLLTLSRFLLSSEDIYVELEWA